MRFAGDGFGEERFACSRRTDEEHAFGNTGADGFVAVRMLEKIDNLLQFVFGLFATGNVAEFDTSFPLCDQPGAAFTETED